MKVAIFQNKNTLIKYEIRENDKDALKTQSKYFIYSS